MSVAFVFQGGGSLAAVQVGMLQALTRAGIRPDLVVGSSAGAVNAVRFAMSPSSSGVARLVRAWREVQRGDLIPTRAWNLIGGLSGFRDGVASNVKLGQFLEREIGNVNLDQTRIPAYVVATDLASGDPITLSVGSAVPALLATTALPGLFAPVEIDGRLLIDGGVTADTPILQAEILGSTETYVLSAIGPVAPEAVPQGAIPVALRALTQLLGR
ncbi:MAG: patatin-like phospholipase family protein, partial [Nitriliruptorales bacterium]|nr:patatin-like phospholipase family protein [Nitriliruptorales bacterium]